VAARWDSGGPSPFVHAVRIYIPRREYGPRQKKSPDGACGSLCRAAPLVRRAGPSGPVVPGPSRATYH